MVINVLQDIQLACKLLLTFLFWTAATSPAATSPATTRPRRSDDTDLVHSAASRLSHSLIRRLLLPFKQSHAFYYLQIRHAIFDTLSDLLVIEVCLGVVRP